MAPPSDRTPEESVLLLVEDDVDIREAIANGLRRAGYQVTDMADGEPALAWLVAQPVRPAVIILDWLLPVMSGGDFLAQLASNPQLAPIPVVVVSAVASSARIPRLCVASVLPKPFALTTLLEVVDGLCAIPRRITEPMTPLPAPAQKRRVLVVDDEEDIRDALSEALFRAGYEVLPAANGREALDQLRALPSQPSLIILDWMMPVMSGGEFLTELVSQAEFSDVPVLALSAFESPRGAPDGAVAVAMTKPVKLRALLEVVDRLADMAYERPSTSEPSPPVARRDRIETVDLKTPGGS